MSGNQVRTVRERLGLTQQQAARRWRVSQAYLSLMEHDRRRVPVRLARLLARHEPTMATALPLDRQPARALDLPAVLGTLGYPGFAYLSDRPAVMNPASVVYTALERNDVPARVTEALPWVLATFPDLDWKWLVDRAKVSNLQNRLGYLVALARAVAERRGDAPTGSKLRAAEVALEEARLVKEDTLGRQLTDAERRHFRQHRPSAAAHWNLLTGLRVEDLRYGL
jgi:transcriptional regulator with XRE-family HTH domain